MKTLARPHFRAQSLEFFLQPLLLQRPLDLDQNLIVVKRLGHVMKRARAHRIHRALDGPERGDEQDGSVAVDLAQALNQFDAFHFRHHEIGDRQVKRRGSMLLDRRFAVVRDVDRISFLAQQVDEQLAHRSIVVDDQDARRFGVRLWNHKAMEPSTGSRYGRRSPGPAKRW